MAEINKSTGVYIRPKDNGNHKKTEIGDYETLSSRMGPQTTRESLKERCDKPDDDYKGMLKIARSFKEYKIGLKLITENGFYPRNANLKGLIGANYMLWLAVADTYLESDKGDSLQNLDIAEKALEIAYDLRPSGALLDRIQKIWNKRMELKPLKH